MNIVQILILCSVLLPIVAAPCCYFLRKKENVSNGFTSIICLAVLACTAAAVFAADTVVNVPNVFLLGISFSTGGFKSVFALLCAGMFFMSSLANPAYFRGEPRNERYRAFLLLTLGGIQGVFFAQDLFTLYIFFETMSLASWVWVAHNETQKSQKAADTYLAMGMIGGLVMLYGLFALYYKFGTVDITQLRSLTAQSTKGVLVPGICLLVGFGIKAGMFPFHVWLPKAHPAAPAPSSALLSGILTKSGIFGILLIITCLLWKNTTFSVLLLVLGTVTMVLGALIAVFSVDLKRTLACSSLSQIGFILVGAAILTIGSDVDLAAGGVMTHAINHALTKLILFISAGVLYQQTHTLDLNKLKGAGRKCWPMMLCFLIGGLSLAGIPGLGGYVSKTLLHEAMVHQMHHGVMTELLSGVEVLFLFSGGLTLAYMTKLFWKIFVQKPDEGQTAVKIDTASLIAIVPAAAALLVMGLIPNLTYEKITGFAAASLGCKPFTVSYFALENLKGAAISITVGLAVYFLFIRAFLTDRKTGAYTKATTVLDLEDDVYRPLLNAIAFVGALAARLCYSVTDAVVNVANRLLHLGAARRIVPGKDHHFSHYRRGYTKVDPIIQTLQFELLLFGMGVIAIFVYLMLSI